MNISVFIGLAAIFFILGILCIIKGAFSEDENAVPISNPKEIEELKTSFMPNEQGKSSDRQKGIHQKSGPANVSRETGVMASSRSKSQSEIDQLIQKNEQLEQSLQASKRENQQIKALEEKITNIQKEKERLLLNRQLIDELKAKGELFERRHAENKIQQEELRESIRTLESEKEELIKAKKHGVNKSELNALSSRLESSIAAIEVLKGENKDLQQFNQNLKDDFKKTKEQNTHLLEKENIMEYELSKNRAQNLGLEKICEDFKVQIENLTNLASNK